MSFKRIFPVITAWVLCSGSGLAQDLPDGAGKETVAAACSGCHNINVIRGGYSPEGWRTVIRMMQNVGAPVPQDQWDTIAEYLIKNFPERPKPAAAIIERR